MIKLGMFRSAVFFVTVVGGFGVACDVGSVLAQQSGDGGGSGSGGGTGSDCPTPATASPGTGHHPYNGGSGDAGATVITAAQVATGCMGASGCHNGSNSPILPDDVWDYGGVAYKDIAGTMPYAGATILLGTEPTSGSPVYTQMLVGENGFFYHVAGIDGFPDPAQTTFINAWICDGTTKTIMSQSLGTMSSQNTAAMTNDGNCNGGTACHGVSGATGGEFIYLPPAS